MHHANLQLKELIENNIVENIVVTTIHCSMRFSLTLQQVHFAVSLALSNK